jgi:hypothetical protein
MGGQTTFQRSTMTANLGTYYLDTSVSLNTQNTENFTTETPINVNVFQGGQTYFMYFLYTQPNTQQTYQVYVGPGFDPTTDLQGMRSLLNTLPMVSTDITLSPTLPTGWTWHYNDSTACAGFSSNNCGILQVTTNFSALTDVQTIPANGMCLPNSFCSASGNSCGCALKPSDPLAPGQSGHPRSMQAGLQRLVGEGARLPPAGVYGFAFTLPAAFTPTTRARRSGPCRTSSRRRPAAAARIG